MRKQISILQNPEYLENEMRYRQTKNAILPHFVWIYKRVH